MGLFNGLALLKVKPYWALCCIDFGSRYVFYLSKFNRTIIYNPNIQKIVFNIMEKEAKQVKEHMEGVSLNGTVLLP